jgi:hypothetical protein
VGRSEPVEGDGWMRAAGKACRNACCQGEGVVVLAGADARAAVAGWTVAARQVWK